MSDVVLPTGTQHEVIYEGGEPGPSPDLIIREQRAWVVEVGGGLREYTVGGRPVLDGYPAQRRCTGGRGQVLVPWPNRVRDGRYSFAGSELQLDLSEPAKGNASHGLARWRAWTAAEPTSPGTVRMSHLLHPQPGYPFILELGVEYVLAQDGLTVTLSARNRGREPCPYGAGQHPYLHAGPGGVDGATLHLRAATRLISDERSIPVGREAVVGSPYDFNGPRAIGSLVLDTCFTDLARDGDGIARAILDTGERLLTLWIDEAFRCLMVFSGDTLPPEERRRGLAVEPMTCPPNALQSGEDLVVLEPGETHTARWGIEVA
ncbi:MAG TPA: aldose 1-epimerase family protein [Solirubrobacteraceae bacterium]|jgi:aldose 1-epimerase|nr:aldose 1-epimerase family protein [Solirubrobacteraceae bacterium]